MAVLHPVKLTITNYPEGTHESFRMENNPADVEAGTHEVTFSRNLYIERDDFLEQPVKGYFRMFPGNEVRLKSAYVVKCTGAVKDKDGNIVEIQAVYDPETRGGNTPDGRRVKGTIHWVDAETAVDAEVRLYSSLFTSPDPDDGDQDFLECLNPDSLTTLTGCKLEASLSASLPGDSYQFLRLGYFCADNRDSAKTHLVFNRSVSLKDSFNK